jgi:hypothetical protein
MLFSRASHQPVGGLLLGMLFRMGLPLAAVLVLYKSRSELLQAGAIGMLLTAYLIGLIVETILAWWIVETSSAMSAPTAKAS